MAFLTCATLGHSRSTVPARVVPEISKCAWEPLFSRLPECEPVGTTMGATMSQWPGHDSAMARRRKIAVNRMIAGVRWEPVVPGAISGASDEDHTCIYTGEVHDTPKYPA